MYFYYLFLSVRDSNGRLGDLFTVWMCNPPIQLLLVLQMTCQLSTYDGTRQLWLKRAELGPAARVQGHDWRILISPERACVPMSKFPIGVPASTPLSLPHLCLSTIVTTRSLLLAQPVCVFLFHSPNYLSICYIQL